MKDRDRALPLLRRELRGDAVLTGANIPYDAVVSMREWPELITDWFNAMEQGRVHDVRIAEALDLLATVGDPDAGKGGVHSLEQIVRRRVGLDLSQGKSGTTGWRLRFHELDGVDSRRYPQDAKDYVNLDSDAARQAALHQPRRKPAWLHTNAAICYFLKTVRGLKVDVKAKEKLQAQVEHDLHPDRLPLIYKPADGLPALVIAAQPARPGLTKEHTPDCRRPPASKGGCACPRKTLKAQPAKIRKKDVLIPRILRACEMAGIAVPRKKVTAKAKEKAEKAGLPEPLGNVKTDEDTLKLLSGFDPVLEQGQVYKTLDKLRTSYFPALEWPFGSGITAKRVFCGYDYIKKTGRGSGRGNSKKNAAKANYPSVAIQLADPRVRGVYVPTGPTKNAPKGFCFLVADYSSIDLCCLAQTIKDLYGSSTLLDQINAGTNPHTFLATVLAFESDPKFRKKIAGMDEADAYATFVGMEKDPVDTHTLPHIAGKCECPNFYKRWRELAKKVGLGLAGGMGIDTFVALVRKELRITITKAQAKAYKKIWFRVYPEMRWYLQKWVPAQKDYTGDWLGYTSPLGMRRVKCSYTECANGRALQSPAAEGMKYADWLVTRACYDPMGLDGSGPDVLYGCYPVINMHDELVLEIPISDADTMNAQALRLQELMIQGMRLVLKDVAVEAKPYLTMAWVKKAKQVKDKKGRIVIWRPEA